MKTKKVEYWMFLEDLEYRLYENNKKHTRKDKQNHERA